jgi:hypothetical protein
MSVQKQFSVKERLRIQLRLDAFNVFSHANFTGLNTTLNFTGYPNSTLANNATPYNAAGQLGERDSFGSVTVPALGPEARLAYCRP